MLERKRPRPKLNTFDRLFWTTLRGVWSRWAEVLVIVRSESVVSAAAEFLTATAPPELIPGETVAHHRVEAKLGHGGMGCGPTHVEHFR